MVVREGVALVVVVVVVLEQVEVCCGCECEYANAHSAQPVKTMQGHELGARVEVSKHGTRGACFGG